MREILNGLVKSTVYLQQTKNKIFLSLEKHILKLPTGRVKNNEPELTEDEKDIIEKNINDLLNLGIYSLPTLKINSNTGDEDVADISFV